MPSPARLHPEFCGCDEAAVAGKLIPVNIALLRGLRLAEPVVERDCLPLEDAAGRILAQPIRAPVPLPPFDNSAMDGYALCTEDTQGGGPWTLPVAGRIAAGSAGDRLAAGTAVRILTGAPIPPGADTVVMQENVLREGGRITLDARPRPGLNIRRQGEDLVAGAEILPAGTEIDARRASALAACGAARVAVHRKVRVAIFSTGSELRHPGETLWPGQIWNANRFMLRTALRKPWIELQDLGTVPDDPQELCSVLTQAAHAADLVVSTGGVSVGDEDHMPRLVRDAGGEIHAMHVAMKPGKPVALGRLGRALYVGLPGNPVSAFVTWHVLGAAILGRLGGKMDAGPSKSTVKAGFNADRDPGRCEFRPARIAGYDATGAEIAEALHPSFSARVALLAQADGLVLIPAECERVREGDILEFIRF